MGQGVREMEDRRQEQGVMEWQGDGGWKVDKGWRIEDGVTRLLVTE